MKKVLLLLAVLFISFEAAYAVGRDGTRSVSDFTGENMLFTLTTVSSHTASSQLVPYSSSRGAATIINVSTNTVYLSTASQVSNGSANSYPLPAGGSIVFRNNAAVFGSVAANISIMSVGVCREW